MSNSYHSSYRKSDKGIHRLITLGNYFMMASSFVLVLMVVVSLGSSEGCYSQQDCGSNECCVSNNPPRGKRMSLLETGHCQAMGQQGSRCLVRYGGGGTTPPPDIVYACPCGAGLMCKGDGHFEVPLGESGVCTHH